MLYILLLITSFISTQALAVQTLPDDPLAMKKPESQESMQNEFDGKKSVGGGKTEQNKTESKLEKKLEKNIIGKAEKWTAIRANPNKNNVCYAILYADERKGNKILAKDKPHEKPYIMVHYFSEGRMRFSSYFGYSLLEYRDVHISIDSFQHKLKSMNEYAITESSEEDDSIITNMKNARNLMIRGEGINYSYSIDFYDISGFEEIFKILQTNCDSTTNNSSFKSIVPTKKDIKKL